MIKSTPDAPHIIQQHNGQITLWSLRVLLRLNLKERFIHHHNLLSTSEILQPLGLMDYFDAGSFDDTEKKKDIISRMEAQLAALEQNPPRSEGALLYNIQLLSQSLPLTDTEKNILQLSVSFYQNNGLGYLTDMIGELSNQQAKQILAVILGNSLEQLEKALSIEGTLLSSGLLQMHSHYGGQELLRQKLILPDAILSALCKQHLKGSSILESFFKISPPAKLLPSDYQHIKQDFRLIQDYLKSVVKHKAAGVNILIYGAPGAGKTEMVRALCDDSSLRLSEITMQSENGEPIHGSERFSILKLSQKLLAESESSVLLFDEVEDVFPVTDTHFYMPSPNGGDIKKGWINSILENNSIPTFWLCNSTSQIDPSYLRRFDYVLKLKPLNSQVRLGILKKYLSDLPVSEKWLLQLSEQEHLVPAIVERAAKVASHLNKQKGDEVEQILEKIIGNTLEVMGLPRGLRKKDSQNTKYALDYLNPDTNLTALCTGLKKANRARICLYGVPGAGKTAFAHYLSVQLGKALLIKRASDIFSKWAGEAEKNIAAMFSEASENDQVLLLPRFCIHTF